MHTAPTPEQGSLSATAAALLSAPLLEAHQADFRHNTWTFKMPPGGIAVAAGRFVLLREDIARKALQADSARTGVSLPPPEGAMRVRFEDRCRIGRGYGCYTLDVEGEGFDCTLWREHCPDADRADSFEPSVWHGYEERRGSDGYAWRRSVRMVCDDFGSLVPLLGSLQ